MCRSQIQMDGGIAVDLKVADIRLLTRANWKRLWRMSTNLADGFRVLVGACLAAPRRHKARVKPANVFITITRKSPYNRIVHLD